MLEIASIILLVFASLNLVFVVTLLAILWFRERKLPPEEKERLKRVRGETDRKYSLAFLFLAAVKLLIFLSIILASLGVALRL